MCSLTVARKMHVLLNDILKSEDKRQKYPLQDCIEEMKGIRFVVHRICVRTDCHHVLKLL